MLYANYINNLTFFTTMMKLNHFPILKFEYNAIILHTIMELYIKYNISTFFHKKIYVNIYIMYLLYML